MNTRTAMHSSAITLLTTGTHYIAPSGRRVVLLSTPVVRRPDYVFAFCDRHNRPTQQTMHIRDPHALASMRVAP